MGVDREGQLVVVGVAGIERKAKHLEADSQGATLVELAALLADAGAVEAVNLDGGGSTQIFFLGGLTTVAGNRLGLPGVHYERMVPSVGILP
jgi:exopolysaccharide biosynthesis protein